MGSLFGIGVSALLATQRQLTTTGHNIANAGTPGYSRQRVDLAARPPQLFGGSFVGKGVTVESIRRVTDQFLVEQVRTSASSLGDMQAFSGVASQVDNLFASDSTGLSTSLTRFFDAMQGLASDPASTPARQALLAAADALADQFHTVDGALDRIAGGIETRLGSAVDEVNGLAEAIAETNREIVAARGAAQGAPPNDLLDRRDALLGRLSELVGVQTFEQDDGAVNVMVGNGQVLVVGTRAERLAAVPSAQDPTRLDIAYTAGGANTVITSALVGGELGGLIRARAELIDGTRTGLGRLAAAVTLAMNAQHRKGMDLNGALGGDLFATAAPKVDPIGAPAGAVTVAFDPAGAAALAPSAYRLDFDGSNLTLTRLADGSVQTLGGPGPFTVDGLTIGITAPMAAGDAFLIDPYRLAARDLTVVVSDPRGLAAAAPIRARAALANIGDAVVTQGEVIDPSDPNLLATVSLVFDDPPVSYRVNGAGPSIPYTSGADIALNGWRVQVSGNPQPGDRFVIEANNGGAGDNRNALAMAALGRDGVLDGGSTSLQDAYAAVVTDVGTRTQRAGVLSETFSALHDEAVSAREAVAGVNLDEEAADLVRFQQAFQAAAQVIGAAQSTFDTLLGVLGRA